VVRVSRLDAATVPGPLLLRSAALLALVTTASLPALTLAIFAGSDLVVADRLANVVRGGAIVVVALGLHPLLSGARRWAAAITSIGVLGGVLAAISHGTMLALDLLATDRVEGLGVVWPAGHVLRDVAWVVQGGWLLAIGRASRGAQPVDVDAGRAATIAGAAMVVGASLQLTTSLGLVGDPTAGDGSTSIVLRQITVLAAVVALPALFVWLLHVAQLVPGSGARGRVGPATAVASRLPGILLATAFVAGAFALLLVVTSFQTQGLGLLAVPLAVGAAMIALHQRLHATMLGARVVTAGGLLGVVMMMMMMEPTVFIGLAAVGTWLLLVGWLGWRRLVLDRPAGVLAIVAGYCFALIGLFTLVPDLMIAAIVVGPIGLASLAIWLGRALVLVRAEDRPARGAAEGPGGTSGA
jgi:hypothetical protein